MNMHHKVRLALHFCIKPNFVNTFTAVPLEMLATGKLCSMGCRWNWEANASPGTVTR